MALPRVRIIGDSISIGYTQTVKHILSGVAEVSRPEENCGSTIEGIEHLSRWLTGGPWDIIHFNWGLHDLKYMGPNGENLADPAAADTKQKVPLPVYKQNLTLLAKRLMETGANLIWCTTTPVPKGAQGRIAGDAATYNKAAAEIITSSNIMIDDLYSFAFEHLDEIQQPENVHFSEDGSRVLAQEVSKSILSLVERLR